MPSFAPSCAQRRLLDFIHENPADQSILGLCKSANVSRATYYRWCRDPNFCAWFGMAWTSRLLMDGIALLNQARAQAPDKFSYWRALVELTFDPKSLGAMAKWQESLTHLSPDAFLPGPNPKSGPKPTDKTEPTDPPPDGELIVHYPPRIPVDVWNRNLAAGLNPDGTPKRDPSLPYFPPAPTVRALNRHLRTLRRNPLSRPLTHRHARSGTGATGSPVPLPSNVESGRRCKPRVSAARDAGCPRSMECCPRPRNETVERKNPDTPCAQISTALIPANPLHGQTIFRAQAPAAPVPNCPVSCSPCLSQTSPDRKLGPCPFRSNPTCASKLRLTATGMAATYSQPPAANNCTHPTRSSNIAAGWGN